MQPPGSRRLSDLPLPGRSIGPPSQSKTRVVTLGGGHGQAALLRALVRLDCDISAIVSVADDGGCSGKLREELGMPPPGDVRRCLVSLASLAEPAARFEERLRGGDEEGRCVGNLVLAEMTQDLGSLLLAAEWAGALLGCVGRVIPAAEQPGTLAVYDLVRGRIDGEAAIERAGASAIVAKVEGPEVASEPALEAIAQADLVFIGPGSFVGSTLAVLTTANIAAAIAHARARRVVVRNLVSEGAVLEDHERILHDHLVIGSRGESVAFDVLAHGETFSSERRPDGSQLLVAPVADPTGRAHDSELLRRGIAHHLGLSLRHAPLAPMIPIEARSIFERYLGSARARLAALPR